MALTVSSCVLAGSIHGTYSGATLCGCGNTLRQLLVEACVGGYACDARTERESEREREKRRERMREAAGRSDVGLVFVGGPRNRGNLTRCCAATSQLERLVKKPRTFAVPVFRKKQEKRARDHLSSPGKIIQRGRARSSCTIRLVYANIEPTRFPRACNARTNVVAAT